MDAAAPFVREAGAGPAVVCLHSNAASSSQWRTLMDRLAPRHHVLAPDSWGAGKSPDWPSPTHISLQDEVDLIEPVLDAAAPLVLIGHSYGAAIALKAALAAPRRVRALVLCEPTLFALVDGVRPPSGGTDGTDGIRAAVQASAAALDRGDRDAAAMHFIDYWMGAGSWAAMPAARKPAVAASVVNVRRWAHALMTEPTPLAAFSALDMPVLYLIGSATPASARAVAAALPPVLPRVRRVELPGLGHMAPITHADIVNAEIVRFLDSI